MQRQVRRTSQTREVLVEERQDQRLQSNLCQSVGVSEIQLQESNSRLLQWCTCIDDILRVPRNHARR